MTVVLGDRGACDECAEILVDCKRCGMLTGTCSLCGSHTCCDCDDCHEEGNKPLTVKLVDVCPQLEKLRRQLETEREQNHQGTKRHLTPCK